jgi:hypothetical protein
MGYIIPYIAKCQALDLPHLNPLQLIFPLLSPIFHLQFAFPYSYQLTAMPVCRSFSAGRSSSSHSTGLFVIVWNL